MEAASASDIAPHRTEINAHSAYYIANIRKKEFKIQKTRFKVAIKPYAEGVYSLCYGEATKGKRSFAKVRLSHMQREFTHYAMAEQLREDFSFANVAIMR